MMREIPSCPFCGTMPERLNTGRGEVYCPGPGANPAESKKLCPIAFFEMTIDQWCQRVPVVTMRIDW